MYIKIQILPERMKEYGFGLLSKSLIDLAFMEEGHEYRYAISCTACTQATEVLLKARIAQEHPLLIFSKLPKMDTKTEKDLDLQDLFERGRTLSYEELPSILWAATGYRIEKLDQYVAFGNLRNSIIHFTIPDIRLDEITLKFAFEVLEPIIFDFWQESIMRFVDKYEHEMTMYLVDRLTKLGISYFPYPGDSSE